MKPLECACRAAHAEHGHSLAARAQAADLTWDGWKSWLPVITAAFVVTREPSEAMSMAGYEHSAGCDAAWTAMMDAMLADQ